MNQMGLKSGPLVMSPVPAPAARECGVARLRPDARLAPSPPAREPTVRPDGFALIIRRFTPIIYAKPPVNSALNENIMGTKYKYNSLEDFLISHPLNVDIEADDGWGAKFPVKGIEIEATVLFADITGFSKRTLDMSPTEILIFVNNFFSWITAEAIKDTIKVLDRYGHGVGIRVYTPKYGEGEQIIRECY